MTLQTSGPISFNNLRTEYQRTGALSLSQLYGQPGIPTSGKISLGDFYGKSMKHTKVIAANQNNINIQNLFTAAEWSSTAPKEVIINTGVIVGDAARSGFAIRSNTGRGGTLAIINNGEIQGFAGNPNSGAGGAAIYIDQAGVTITNNWAVRGGGGAGGVGGVGGTGGGGYFNTTSRDPVSGFSHNGNSYEWINYKNPSVGVYTGTIIKWAGANVFNGNAGANATSVVVGGHTYLRGGLDSSFSTQDVYAIARSWLVQNNTNGGGGGAGGTGGYGQGYNRARSNGVAGAGGAAGGTNAGSGGTGGTGGNGGTWGAAGAAGNTGATGATGNRTGGAAGGGGGALGAAGRAVGGPIAATVINNNTINGAY